MIDSFNKYLCFISLIKLLIRSISNIVLSEMGVNIDRSPLVPPITFHLHYDEYFFDYSIILIFISIIIIFLFFLSLSLLSLPFINLNPLQSLSSLPLHSHLLSFLRNNSYWRYGRFIHRSERSSFKDSCNTSRSRTLFRLY